MRGGGGRGRKEIVRGKRGEERGGKRGEGKAGSACRFDLI